MIKKFKAKEARTKATSSKTLVVVETHSSPSQIQEQNTTDVTKSFPSPLLIQHHTSSPTISDSTHEYDELDDDYTLSTAFSPESFELIRQYRPHVSYFSLAPTLEDRACAFFVSNYVVNAAGPTRGHLDYLANVCGESGGDEGLLASM